MAVSSSNRKTRFFLTSLMGVVEKLLFTVLSLLQAIEILLQIPNFCLIDGLHRRNTLNLINQSLSLNLVVFQESSSLHFLIDKKFTQVILNFVFGHTFLGHTDDAYTREHTEG
jgi:hypothetical protein